PARWSRCATPRTPPAACWPSPRPPGPPLPPPCAPASWTRAEFSYLLTQSQASLPDCQCARQVCAKPDRETLSDSVRLFPAGGSEGVLAHYLHRSPIRTIVPTRGNFPRSNDRCESPRVTADTSNGEQHVKSAVQLDLQPNPMVVPGEVREIIEFLGEVDPL